MKCKHCDYEHGFSTDVLKHIEGEAGDFWTHPVNMQRQNEWSFGYEHTTLFGCPSCEKTFVDKRV